MMTNFNTLEELRTKEELVNYFAKRGQSITKEEIEALKKSYERVESESGTLALQQLDNVAEGIIIGSKFKDEYNISCVHGEKWIVKLGGYLYGYDNSTDDAIPLSCKLNYGHPFVVDKGSSVEQFDLTKAKDREQLTALIKDPNLLCCLDFDRGLLPIDYIIAYDLRGDISAVPELLRQEAIRSYDELLESGQESMTLSDIQQYNNLARSR